MKKVVSRNTLRQQLRKPRSQRKKIVFTNGCFDILHVGHLAVFEQCKKQGDILVVGLNSDKSVRRLKGAGRPVVPEKDRARMLAGLGAVDYVTIFKEDTPSQLIRKIKPDVLVKGGDWKPSEIVGREFVKKVVRIPVLKGRSTTNIIDRVLSRYGRKKGKSH